MPVVNVQSNLMQMAAIKSGQELLAAEYKRLEGEVADALRARGASTATVKEDGKQVKGTLVEGMRTIIHEEPLLKSLNAAQRKEVTKQVLDTEKLEAAVALGHIPMTTVAKASETKPVKPYVKISGDKVPAGWKSKPRVTRPKKKP